MLQPLEQTFTAAMERNFKGSACPETVAVAVSGGSDSMALVLLLDQWARKNNVSLVGITVDHALRAEAKEEAQLVGQWLARYQIEHCILTRQGEVPQSGIQAFARDARYRLISEFCKNREIDHLFTGHQLEDQLETFVQRFAMGSALSGLRAMSEVTTRDGLQILRPLLGVRRKSLRDFLTQNGQDWIEDPSNEDPKYTRTALGRVVRDIAALPESSLEKLSLSINRLQSADAALNSYAQKAWDTWISVSEFGFATVDAQLVESEAKEIALRCLQRAISVVNGQDGYSRLKEIERLYDRIVSGEDQFSSTLSGCLLQVTKGQLRISREPGRAGLEILPYNGGKLIWDNRFCVSCAPEIVSNSDRLDSFRIRVIGEDGWQQIADLELLEEAKKLPAQIRKNLPSLWQGEKLVAAPLILAENAGLGIANDALEMVFIPTVGAKRSS